MVLYLFSRVGALTFELNKVRIGWKIWIEFSLWYSAVVEKYSYLTKVATKDINDGNRNMGLSQYLICGTVLA